MANVYKLKKKNKKKHRLLKFIASVLLLAVISIVAALLITNDGKLDIEGIVRLFSGTDNKADATEFSFEADAGSVYADMDGGLAVCSGGGLQVYDAGAKKVFSEAFDMSNPAVISNGTIAAVYDLGGTSLKVFDQYGVTKSLTTEGSIISAALNKNGWLALCTQESGAYKGLVTVYDAKTEKRYYWYSAEGHVFSAAVSQDDKSLTVLTMTDEGSRIVFFTLDSPDEKGACVLSGEPVLDIKYISDGKVLAISGNALRLVRPDGGADVLYDYSGKYLAGYSTDGDDFTAIALHDYMVGDQGRIVTVDHSGKLLGTAEAEGEIVSLSAKGNYLAALYSDGLVLYDKNMKECARFDEVAGAEQTIMRPSGKALLITAHSATLYSIPAD